jgi:hypothetical protein
MAARFAEHFWRASLWITMPSVQERHDTAIMPRRMIPPKGYDRRVGARAA